MCLCALVYMYVHIFIYFHTIRCACVPVWPRAVVTLLKFNYDATYKAVRSGLHSSELNFYI